jgi:beta-galactosidase
VPTPVLLDFDWCELVGQMNEELFRKRGGMKPKLSRRFWVLVAAAVAVAAAQPAPARVPDNIGGEISLDGVWDTGIDRHYDARTPVPGLAEDPGQMSPGTLWYRRSVPLPEGNWTTATLRLGGARFAPTVYVDGEKISGSEGGMAPIEIPLRGKQVRPGGTIQLEIALKSLRDLDPRDASAVPAADRWRSDISSSLWDDVALHLSGAERICRIVPWTDFSKDRVSVHWEIAGGKESSAARTMQAFVLDQAGNVLASSQPEIATTNAGATELDLNHACKAWSPESPNLYRLKLVLSESGRVEDSRVIPWGMREFRTQGLGFVLNNEPIHIRGGSVVWHRWLRDPEAKTLAFESGWFETNIVLRLKGLGANFLRFHLGLPPESLLDLCDRDGLLVQMEWPFFHGVKASPESMTAQWRAWLDVGMHHPCVVLLQPWNETEGDELTRAWAALNAVLPEYPPWVIDHRDVIPIHKYWWSLFENLGLYYDSATQFDRPIMVDEFGGNYLDGNGNVGADAAAHDGFVRFLGADQTPALRLRFQAESNARVAEYWRRLGAAGFAPFCILSSPQDGNTWFLGPLRNGKPKPVWAAMSAAYAPASVSLEVWDRNYTPGEIVSLPLYFFNDTGERRNLNASVRIVSTENPGRIQSVPRVEENVPAHGVRKTEVKLQMPAEQGNWRFEAELRNPPQHTSRVPVVSSWRCRTLDVVLPPALRGMTIGASPDDAELRAFLAQNGLRTVGLDDPQARVLVLSAPLWRQLQQSSALRDQLETAVDRGQSVVLLDIGPHDLGQGYKKGDLGPLEGAPRVKDPYVERDNLFCGIQLIFREAAEPESHLHPAPDDDSLWAYLPRESTWLWNGLRGGLVVPSADMEVRGLSAPAFLSLWASRGANAEAVRQATNYFAYELAGFYAFSPNDKDKDVMDKLRAKVRLLAEDAPALQDRINPKAPMQGNNIAQIYHQDTAQGKASTLQPLAVCGKNLTRIPVIELTFGPSKGRVILSQALTAGRLVRGHQEPGLYGIRYDPAAEQFTLNMIAKALDQREATQFSTRSY